MWPCQGDEADWAGVFTTLREIGYDGDCSIETYVPTVGRQELITNALMFLRTL